MKLTEKDIKEMIMELNKIEHHQMLDKEGKPVCILCGRAFIKIKKHEWKGNCGHFPANFTLLVGAG
jgi:hypothetical protein